MSPWIQLTARHRSFAPTVFFCVACGSGAGSERPAQPSCAADVLESDLDANPLRGPLVDPTTGKLSFETGTTYVVTSTYGVPKPGRDGAPVNDKFQRHMAAISDDLMRESGLLALSLASSDACHSVRTLAVWKSADAMEHFVGGAAHASAMADVEHVFEPSYRVTHWSATAANQATWQTAVRKLATAGEPGR